MKKALQGENEGFFTWREGKLQYFKIGDIDWLLAAANDAPHLEDKKKNGMTIRYKNGVPAQKILPDEMFCCWVKRYMEWIVAEGVTEAMVNELNELLSDVRYIHVLSVSKSGEAYWQHNIADMQRDSHPPDFAAYALSHHLAAGGLSGLKRCELSDCRKFFVGRTNMKWCSKSCGAKHRVRKKRKRDRE